jgi:hypothetical protein
MLSIPAFHFQMVGARGDEDLAERILAVLDLAASKLATLARAGITVGHDVGLAKYSHDTYLPAAANYLRYGSVHSPSIARFREDRARLGGASRWLYAHQRKTFEDVLKLLPFTSGIPAGLVDHFWNQVLTLERRRLAKARAAAGSRQTSKQLTGANL